MRLQDFVVRQTQKALMDLIRAAEALPDEKRIHPLYPGTRSLVSIMQEVAVSPEFYILLLNGGVISPTFHSELMDRARSFETFEVCREVALDSTARLCNVILSFPDEGLDDELVLPFGPGVTMTMADVLAQHYWNMVYHFGQVNYMQMTLGDQTMH